MAEKKINENGNKKLKMFEEDRVEGIQRSVQNGIDTHEVIVDQFSIIGTNKKTGRKITITKIESNSD